MIFQEGNRLTLLRCGTDYFPALLDSIAGARQLVHLETYIYADDRAGREVTQALCDAAKRGATVRILVDGFGSRHMSMTQRQVLREAGVDLLVFRPEVTAFRLRRHRLRRMHRKIATIDGQVAFVGGINIVDDFDEFEAGEFETGEPGQSNNARLDYAVRIEGPLAAAVSHEAQHLWRRVSWARLRRRGHADIVLPTPASAGTQRGALVVRDNLRHRDDIENAYLDSIAAARTEIIVANAYFFPGRRFRRALEEAAHRGVAVVLLLQGRSDHPLLQYAWRALYGPLLDSGVRIHEYARGVLHAKVAVIDATRATVGSSNIDPFSLLLAKEANIFIDDPEFAHALREDLRIAIASGANEIAPAHWRSQSIWRKFPHWIAYALARISIGLFGYGGQL
ncbi:MAG: cardiolipin synthase ClsB [Burkholderiales bacterium]